MPNRLAKEISPYLLQHAENPVDWYPWSSEALAAAKELERPIFLSIGYAACHWCHVMERESFEDEEIAAFLNQHFVSIKVDREERPDLDQVYMQAVMALRGGQGGWPLSAFLTPNQEVFFGGTYWPPSSRHGMPGFLHVLQQVDAAFNEQRELIEQQAGKITDYLSTAFDLETGNDLELSSLDQLVESLDQAFDDRWGGFGTAPKFPHPMDLQLLTRLQLYWPDDRSISTKRLRQMVDQTLDSMASGGIYDHLGGGFARYSVDREWLVPHFEKMLYDNALLGRAYLENYLVSRRPNDKRIVVETLEYICREMTHSEGAYFSTEDADSEGEEGKFYVWRRQELQQQLDAELFHVVENCFGVTEGGNFEAQTNILFLPRSLDESASQLGMSLDEVEQKLAQARQLLFETRAKRVRPGLDDKVIVSWNGMMISTMALAGWILDDPRFIDSARRAATFVLTVMRGKDGRLAHAWRNGVARQDAFLDDYAAMIEGLVILYEATLDEAFVDQACELADVVLEWYQDPDGGGFFFTASDQERLITRSKDWQDSSVPSGNSLLATGLLRLGYLINRRKYVDAAEGILHALLPRVAQSPMAGGQAWLGLLLQHQGPTECAIVASNHEQRQALHRELALTWSSARLFSIRETTSEKSTSLDGLFAGRQPGTEQPVMYVCQHHTCDAPLSGFENILTKIRELKHEFRSLELN